jgi:hypothetical protein
VDVNDYYWMERMAGKADEMTTDQDQYPERWTMCDGGKIYESDTEGEQPEECQGCDPGVCCGPVEFTSNRIYPDDAFYDYADPDWPFEPDQTVDWDNARVNVQYLTAEAPQPQATTEVRFTDPETGGQKGQKPEEYAFIPSHPLAEVARVYGMGAEKYEPWNWAKGYPWRLSYSALYRHIEAHRRGESVDPDSGFSHLAHAAFHLFTLMEFERLGLGTDDRWTA